MPKIAMKIFMYRGRMSPVKGNFKTKYEYDLSCPVQGCGEIDEQDHLLAHCDTVNSNDKNIINNVYAKLFSDDPDEVLTVYTLLAKVMSKREDESETLN